MRIIIPTFEEIRLMPPTITLFNVLANMGYHLIYITIFPDEYAKNFENSQIVNAPLFKRNYTLKYNFRIPNIVGVRGLIFRIDIIIKSICAHKLKRWLLKYFKNDDLLWIVNEMTPMLAGSSFSKKFKDRFIFTIYELHSKKWATRNIMKTAQNAKLNVVCEYNRAHMQKYFFNLKRLPIVLPNKPANMIRGRNLPIENEEISKRITDIKESDKKIILYMGIIGPERPMEKLIEAVKERKSQYELVLLGRPGTYLDYLNSKYQGDFTYLGYVTPPQHLYIASHADIGVLIYVPQGNIGLNALYCAPNKIYEYTGIGLPVITNDIPGLNNFVKTYNCGVTVDIDSLDDIIKGIDNLFDNYKEYQVGAMDLYNAVDINKIVSRILTEAQS